MPNMVENKVVVITGAGSGIGREYALAFAAQGARVVVNDLGRTELGGSAAEAVANEIRQAGGEAIASIESVAQWDSAHRIIECALDQFGRIDTVINNAGIVRDRFFFQDEPRRMAGGH